MPVIACDTCVVGAYALLVLSFLLVGSLSAFIVAWRHRRGVNAKAGHEAHRGHE